jgi:TPR repeat protein
LQLPITADDGTTGLYDGCVLVADNSRHGLGTFTTSDGHVFDGEWRHGKRSGKGKYTRPNGECFQGEWSDEPLMISGVYTWPSSQEYQGEFQRGLFHGQGVLSYSNGEVYQGEWCNGCKEGRGKMSWPGGKFYQGEFRNGKFHGKGTMTIPGGDLLVALWDDGYLHGLATLSHPNGRCQITDYLYGVAGVPGPYEPPSYAPQVIALFEAAARTYLCGQYAACTAEYAQAIDHGHLQSRADLAWILIFGREGVPIDKDRAFNLVLEGARMGCPHCQGVLSCCRAEGFGCAKDVALAMQLARESASCGSRYGQYMIAESYYYELDGKKKNFAEAAVHYRLAAAQLLDEAQNSLGYLHNIGHGVIRDKAEGLKWYKLAAAQGFPIAYSNVAACYECGEGVPVDIAEATRWYELSAAAGELDAVDKLKSLASKSSSSQSRSGHGGNK